MLLTIFIIATIVSVVGAILFFSGFLFDESSPLLFVPAVILLNLGGWTFLVTGILLLVKIAFPALGT